MAKAIGIDLGTTMSAVAAINDYGRSEIVPNSEGNRTTPSIIWFKENERVVGDVAKRAMVAHPQDVVRCVKRHMCDRKWIWIDKDGNEHDPVELSAIILKKLVQDAEKHDPIGEKISEVVITVPAYFGEIERERTKEAGKAAGLEVLKIVNEPTAAAYAYEIAQEKADLTFLVYDLGGGTFDTTVMQVSEGDIKVITSRGDKKLGGEDFDEKIVTYFAEQFEAEHGFNCIDAEDTANYDRRAHQDFFNKAEDAKKSLSNIGIEDIEVGLSGSGKTLDVKLTRNKFEELINSYIESTIDLTEQALADAGQKLDKPFGWENIDRVLLVGGSSRIPLVQKRIEEVSEKKPRIVRPDEMVALGAAIEAARILGIPLTNKEGERISIRKSTVVTAHAFGVIAWNEMAKAEENAIIVPQNTELPAEKKNMFSTVEDGETSVRIRVVQGESKDPAACEQIGEKEGYLLENIPPMPKGDPQIEVKFKLDDEAIIQLEAKELLSGQELKVTIERPEVAKGEQIKKVVDQVKTV